MECTLQKSINTGDTMTDELIKKIGKTDLYVVQGDITKIPADALMTAINSGGMWYGGIDGAIQRVAGDFYHKKAAAMMPLEDLQTVVAKGKRTIHTGQFNDVVFVVDDLKSSLDEVVYAGLEASHNAGHRSLLLPAIRMGVMAGVREKTPQEAAQKISLGVQKFIVDYGTSTKLTNLTFVIYNDINTFNAIGYGLKHDPRLN
jgi:O-acetyl-ADP-ribose deacetylase (regulator of RNase III)